MTDPGERIGQNVAAVSRRSDKRRRTPRGLLKEAQVTVGAAAVAALHTVRADVCVLGICSLHPDVGVTTLDSEEAHVKRAMVACSGTVIALATADKLRTASAWVVAQLNDVDHLVTDGGHDLTLPYSTAGINVVTV